MRFIYFLVLSTALVCAHANAEEEWVSVGSTQVVTPASGETASSSSQPSFESSQSESGLINELLLQVEQMQQEISSLRGQLEQQKARLQKMELSQKDRYLDLDRRLSKITTPTDVVIPVAQVEPDSSTSQDEAVETEQAQSAYDQAYALLKERKFDEAEVAFDGFVQDYPDDALVANALYWSAEVSLIRGDLDKATNNFRTIVNTYPQHNKAPDALYKLGVTVHRQGNNEEARVLLNKVVEDYSGIADGTVVLARSYLTKISQ